MSTTGRTATHAHLGSGSNMDELARILYDVWMDEMVRRQLISEVPWWNASPNVKEIWGEVAARARYERKK